MALLQSLTSAVSFELCVIPKICIDKFARKIYDMNVIKNTIIPTFKRAGIASEKNHQREKKNTLVTNTKSKL